MTEKIRRDFVRRAQAADKIRKKIKGHPDQTFAEFLAKRLREIKEGEEEKKK